MFWATKGSISTQMANVSVKSTTANILMMFFSVYTCVTACHISPKVDFLFKDHSALKHQILLCLLYSGCPVG